MSAVSDDARLRETTPTTFYEDLVKLPGYGEAPNRCRDMTPVGFCDHGHVLLGRSSCGTRYCPDHWRDWLEDAVVSLVARLAAYRESRDGWEKRMCHVVASPPQDRRYSTREMWETRSDAYRAFEAAGLRGGAVVTHPYRTTLELDRLYETADVDEGVGKWRFLRDLVDDLESGGWDDVAEYIEPSPHYHALAAVEDVSGDDAPDGWIVENVRSFERFDFEDRESYEDMIRTAYYVLTHAGVQDGRSSTTYFGEVHPATFSPEDELAPAVWRRIQREAEAAVKGVESEESDGVAAGPDECPRDGCESVVMDLESLPDRLDDDEWCRDVRLSQGGRERLAQLRGCLAWYEDRTDRPPPSARRSESKMLTWLRERGEVFIPEPSQVSLNTVMS